MFVSLFVCLFVCLFLFFRGWGGGGGFGGFGVVSEATLSSFCVWGGGWVGAWGLDCWGHHSRVPLFDHPKVDLNLEVVDIPNLGTGFKSTLGSKSGIHSFFFPGIGGFIFRQRSRRWSRRSGTPWPRWRRERERIGARARVSAKRLSLSRVPHPRFLKGGTLLSTKEIVFQDRLVSFHGNGQEGTPAFFWLEHWLTRLAPKRSKSCWCCAQLIRVSTASN